jgi:hypothetical protein
MLLVWAVDVKTRASSGFKGDTHDANIVIRWSARFAETSLIWQHLTHLLIIKFELQQFKMPVQ